MALKKRGSNIGGGGGHDIEVSASADWEDVETTFDPTSCGLIIDLIGEEGTGRSTLALTMPGPIAYINSDEKIHGIVEPFAAGTHPSCNGVPKKIRVATYGFIASNDKQDTLSRAEAVFGKVKGWLADSIGWAETTILDTGTEAWEMCRLSNFGELNPKGNRMDNLYGPVNAEFRSLFKQFRLRSKTIVAIHQVKDEYKDVKDGATLKSVRTGLTRRAGFREMGYIANIVIRTTKIDGVFRGTVEKGWFNAATEGLSLEGADCRMPLFLSLIAGTEESEWL